MARLAPSDPALEIAAPAERLTSARKMAYGLGSLTDFFFANVIGSMFTPIFQIAMKMDPAKLGIAMAATKIIGALADPFVGFISDNTRSRWGRRRPYILGATALGALLLPLVWMPPASPEWLRYGFVIAMVTLMTLLYSVFAIPYGALGCELTSDYDDRTRLFAWKNYINMIGVFASAWFYWFCLRPFFGSEITGVRVLSLLSSLIMILGALAVIRGTREKPPEARIEKKDRIPVARAIRETFSNRPFLLIQAAALVVSLGTGVNGPIGLYLHVNYTCHGDKAFASVIGGVGGTLSTLSIFLATPLGVWVSTRLGKREAALVGMGFMLLSVLVLPWVLSAVHPWWIVSSWVLSTLGIQCASLMFSSMMADICDEDELSTGLRREGTYSAAASFLAKLSAVIMLLVGGFLPRIAGYLDTTVTPTLPQLERMKWLLIATQLVGSLISIACLWFYPITRERAQATRCTLASRRGV